MLEIQLNSSRQSNKLLHLQRLQLTRANGLLAEFAAFCNQHKKPVHLTKPTEPIGAVIFNNPKEDPMDPDPSWRHAAPRQIPVYINTFNQPVLSGSFSA